MTEPSAGEVPSGPPSDRDRPAASGPAASLSRALGPLVVEPSRTAIITDFDGTLSPIVADPATARPLPGAADALTRLTSTFGLVAVVSGRPVAFLADRLPGVRGVDLVGLYGLEQLAPDGRVVTAEDAEPWRPVVAAAAERLEGTVSPGVLVEGKGLTVTVHWRRAPERATETEALVAAEVIRTALQPHPGRMSIELRPPLAVDKGTAVEALAGGFRAACFLGDDLGDLPAFAALARLSADRGVATVSVAAVDAESAPEVAAAADLVVEGPTGALDVIRWLADNAAVPDTSGTGRAPAAGGPDGRPS